MKLKLSALALLLASANLYAQTEVRLAVHKSFSLPQSVIAQFEKANDAKVSVIKAGSGNEMLNKLILSKANPIADAVYGLDNANIGKAKAAGILAASQPKSAPVTASLPDALAVDYAYVAINYDKKWFEQKKLPLPQTLQDLTKPEYKNLLVTPSPATSSPGLSFLLANIGGMGEEGAFKWWAQMRQNGVKVAKGWSEAYGLFLKGESDLVLSYTTSPAYHMIEEKKDNYAAASFAEGHYLQVEVAARTAASKQPELAEKFLKFMVSPGFQNAIPTGNWMYPVTQVTLPAGFDTLVKPQTTLSFTPQQVASERQTWISAWQRAVSR